jgi:DNA-binding XRE family transcriptional regulator
MQNEKLIARRIARGFNQSALAQKADLPITTYSYYERGQREPSVSRAIRIASALRCKVEDIF